ncbi:MAG: thioredoxin family protein [Fimbriimonadales bacterium]
MTTIFAAGIAAVLVAPQGNTGADLLAKHMATLQGAKSLSVTFTVQQLPGAAQEYKLILDRDNGAKIITPTGYIVTDGKTTWDYTKSSNEYIERAGGISDMADTFKKDDFATWAGFFMPNMFKAVTGVTAGNKMNMKGNVVTPINFTIDKNSNKVGVLYFDEKLGMARAANFKAAKNNDSVEVLIIGKELTVGNSNISAETFAFTAPEGAKKVEIREADLAKWYHNLDEAYQVAKSTNRMLFVDFNATWCGPCQMYKRSVFTTPQFQAMGKYYVFVDIDTDEQPDLAQKFGASAIPDLHFLKSDGTEVHRVVGYKGMALLDDMEMARKKG